MICSLYEVAHVKVVYRTFFHMCRYTEIIIKRQYTDTYTDTLIIIFDLMSNLTIFWDRLVV